MSITSTPRTHELWLVDEHLQVEHVYELYRVIVCPWICWSSFGELCHVFPPFYTNGLLPCNNLTVQFTTYDGSDIDPCMNHTRLIGLELLFVLLAGFTVHRLLMKNPGRWNRFDWTSQLRGVAK